MNIKQEMRRIIKEALSVMGGTGGKRECRYCGRESFPGQPAHWRKDFAGKDGPESNDHCVVTVLRAALRREQEGPSR